MKNALAMAHPSVSFRKAVRSDLAALVEMLADDVLGAGRERGLDDLSAYEKAFEDIDRDINQFLCVVELDGEIVGTLQLTFIPGLARHAARRGQIEAVRVASSHRGQGIGEAMFEWAIRTCREQGCALVQLTTDKARPDAHRFYEKLGFEGSHIGYKKRL